MSTSQTRIDANRKNAQKSSGPRTDAGKNISKYNRMSHGLTAKAAVIPTEDAAAYEQRMIDVGRTLGPRNVVEALLAAQAGYASWVFERAVKADTARLSAKIEDGQAAELDEIDSLFNRLFHDARYPNVISGAIPWDHIGPRTSHSGLANHPDDPARLVRKIVSSVLGCERMLEHWSALLALLEPGKSWQGNHKFMATRLLGKQPTDVLNSREIADIYVACWSIDSVRRSPYSEMRSDLGRTEYKHFVRRVRGTWTDMMNACDQENSRRVLVAIVEGAIARVKVKAAEARERAERDAARRADCLSFDDSREAELLRRYATTNHRQFVRSLNEFFTVRRAADELLCEPDLEVDERVQQSEENFATARWATIESVGTTGLPDPISAIDPTDLIDRIDPEMIMSIAPANLPTEPISHCAAAPNNPSIASSEPEPDGLAVVATQFERNGSEPAGHELEGDDHDLASSHTESDSHGVAGRETHSTKRPCATELLLATIVLLCGLIFPPKQWARTPQTEAPATDTRGGFERPPRGSPKISEIISLTNRPCWRYL